MQGRTRYGKFRPEAKESWGARESDSLEAKVLGE